MNHVFQPITYNEGLRPIADHKSCVLILDTMPGEKSTILQQYYAHKNNHFWKIIFNAFHESYQTNYTRRKQLLLSNGIALWNVLANYETKNLSKNYLSDVRTNDFQTFFSSYPGVHTIIFNGAQAANFFKRHVGYNREITYITLPSTSAVNAWKSFDEKASLWIEALRKHLQIAA